MLAAKTLPLISPRTRFHENPNDLVHFFKKKPLITIPKHHYKTTCIKSSSQPTKLAISAENRVEILSEALPFIQKFRDKTFVVKYGGAAMKLKALQAYVIADIVLLSCVGIRVVLVHGGGPEIDRALEIDDIKPNFVNGLRVTDAKTMDVVSSVLGQVSKDLVALIDGAGGSAVRSLDIDGRIVTARPSPHALELGFVGEVSHVDPTVLEEYIGKNHIPVVASVATDLSGQWYNINADTVAGEIAAALGAEKLVLLTDVAGILEDRDNPESLVREINVEGVMKMIDEGKIGGGMIPKVDCCMRSIAQGVRTASIIDGRLKHSLLLEVLTDEGVGTMITG